MSGANRTFFYGGYEGYRQSRASSTPVLVPMQKQLAGDFSDDSQTIYNPFSTAPDPAHPGAFIRMPFPGNVIPHDLLNPAALQWATLFPAPGNATVAGYNLTDTTPQRTNQDSYQMRLDQNMGSRDAIFARVSHYSQSASTSVSFPGALGTWNITGWNAALNWTHTFGPSTVLELHLARNSGDDLNTTIFPAAPPAIVSDLEASGFAANFIGNYADGAAYVPTIAIAGYAGAGQLTGRNGLALGTGWGTNSCCEAGTADFTIAGTPSFTLRRTTQARGRASVRSPQTI